MANVLLLTRGTGGDVMPLVRIGQGLKARGHQVTLISSFRYESLARQSGLEFAGLESVEEAARFLHDVDRLARPIEFIRYFRQRVLPWIPQEYATIRQHYRPGDTILICVDTMIASGQMIAEKLNIPLVLLYIAPRNIEFRFGRFAVTKPLNDRNDVFSAEIRALLDLPRTWGAGPVSRLGQWPGWFAPLGAQLPFTVTPIGFIFDHSSEPLPPAVQVFLASGPPPILITHGTSLPKQPNFFAASVQACVRLGQRALLVSRQASGLAEPLPEGVAWFPYVPYGSLLPQLRGIVHHGGIGTCGAAMQTGIPQLILPAGYDRRDNATNVHRLGVGDFVRPHQWRAEVIAGALAGLLDSPGVQARCQEVAGWLHASDPVACACDQIENLLNVRPMALKPAMPVRKKPLPEPVLPPTRLDPALCQRLHNLSAEKRALLAARIRQQQRSRQAQADLSAAPNVQVVLHERLRNLSAEKRALLAARIRQQPQAELKLS